MTLRPVLAVPIALIIAAAVVQGQRAAAPTGTDTRRLRCAAGDAKRDTLGRRPLPGGYFVQIRRDTAEVEYACEARLLDRHGKTVIREGGFGATIDVATGFDINADGTPELVLEMDTGGGNHCCWSFVVISLKSPAKKLFEFQEQGASDFRRDKTGRVTLWSWEGGFYGPDHTMAGRIYAQRVYRWDGMKLVDETPAHCAEINGDTTKYQTPKPTADELRRLNKFGVDHDSTYGLASNIELLMLQEVFCRQFDRALEIGHTMWPAASRAKFITDFHDMVVGAYKEYTAAMHGWR